MCFFNKEGNKDFAITRTIKKQHWISWIARLHNSDEFLYNVVVSRIEVFDEIILIDNNSTDNTATICKALAKEYPWKIQFLQYPFVVAKPYSEAHKQTDPESLHSLVYYYNRCFAQAHYDIVCKIDDDNLLIPDFYSSKVIREKVISMKNNDYVCFWWYNVIQKQWKYHLLQINQRYSWLIWDIWFYYNTDERYFFKDENYEKLNKKWLKMSWVWMVYIHLKYLKKWVWELTTFWKTKYNDSISNILVKELD
jgi:glycosyltransferase involved in cell wall biosynthesis